MSDEQTVERTLEVWVCPICPNYYGASSIKGLDLRTQFSRTKPRNEYDANEASLAKPVTRSRCPDCWTRTKKEVHRELHVIRIKIHSPEDAVGQAATDSASQAK